MARWRRVVTVLVGAGLFAALALPGSALAERTIALNTGTFELSLAPGQQATDLIMVANNGDESLKALVYTADVEIDQEGNQTYQRPDVNPENYLSSPASWIRLKVPDSTKIIANTPYLEFDPGDEYPVEFELVVPNNATPGDYNAVVFFEMFDFDQGTEGATTQVQGRIGARIDLRVVGEVADDLKVSDFEARTFVIGDMTPFSVRVVNAGNIDKKYTMNLRLVGSGETEKWSQLLEEDANVYAKRDRYYDGGLKFDGVGLGKYTLRAELDYLKEVGDAEGTVLPETIVIDRTVWVIPLWLVILVVIFIGLPTLYLTYRLSVRRVRKAAGVEKKPKKSRGIRSKSGSDSEERRLAREARQHAAGTPHAGSHERAPEQGHEAGAGDPDDLDVGPGDGQTELWADLDD